MRKSTKMLKNIFVFPEYARRYGIEVANDQ
jgi:hypothetical protein